MTSNIERFAVEIGENWDLNNLRIGSKAFHNYLKSAVTKYVGSTKPYNRSLIKKISVADGESFMIKFTATKKSNTNLFITYILTAPEGALAVSSMNQEYTIMNEIATDFNFIDDYIDHIDEFEDSESEQIDPEPEPEPEVVSAPKKTTRKTSTTKK